MSTKVPSEITLKAIEKHFHELIRARAGKLIAEHNLVLPELTTQLAFAKAKTGFPIPGMYGGFSYWLEGEGDQIKLISLSWCRIAEGSGQRHEITAAGSRLVDEGFV
jgi:hypothetical protein